MEEPENIKPETRRRIPEYIGAITANGILIYVFNNLYKWGVPFLTRSYQDCIWAIDVSLGAVIIANFVFIFFDRDRFKHLLQVFTSAASFISLYVIHAIFPFEFANSDWYLALNIFLIMAMVISGAGVIYNTIRAIIPDMLKK